MKENPIVVLIFGVILLIFGGCGKFWTHIIMTIFMPNHVNVKI